MNISDLIRSKNATLDDQDEALKTSITAYYFARNIKGADIMKCQEVACKNPLWAVDFAYHIEGADIERCQEAACKDPEEAYFFALYINGADIGKCIEACRGTKWEGMLNTYLMSKALL